MWLTRQHMSGHVTCIICHMLSILKSIVQLDYKLTHNYVQEVKNFKYMWLTRQHMSGHVTCIICHMLSILKSIVQLQENGVWMEMQEVRREGPGNQQT